MNTHTKNEMSEFLLREKENIIIFEFQYRDERYISSTI